MCQKKFLFNIRVSDASMNWQFKFRLFYKKKKVHVVAGAFPKNCTEDIVMLTINSGILHFMDLADCRLTDLGACFIHVSSSNDRRELWLPTVVFTAKNT